VFNTLSLFANAGAASDTLKASVSPLFSTMITIAAVVCILFIVIGGFYYMTSAGNPEKLERAKKTIRNAFIGFVVILGSGALVAIMQNAYTQKAVQPSNIAQVQVDSGDTSAVDIVNESVKKLMKDAVASIGEPVVNLLKQFTTATPLMAQNGAVFNVWVVIVAIVDVLFLLVVAMIGFRIMSASVLGFEDVDIRSLIPQIIMAFIVANLSIFAIDAIITVSNAMIQALLIGMSSDIIWVALGGLISGSATVLNIGVIMLILVAVVLGVMLLIYYLQRLIVLYVGTVLSPLIVLLWLLPSFRDFAVSAAKTFIVTIFVLFVHVTILMLAVSLFSGLVKGEGNEFMTALLGIATLLALLKTSRTMNQMAMMSSGSQGLRKLGNTFVRSASHMASNAKKVTNNTGVGGGVAVSKGASTVVAGARPSTPASSSLITRQVSHKRAAEELTSKSRPKYEPIVTPGKSTGKVSLTEQPLRAAPKIIKGAAK
jgi:hypothetical protein